MGELDLLAEPAIAVSSAQLAFAPLALSLDPMGFLDVSIVRVRADVNRNGVVQVDDMLAVMGDWGAGT